MPQGQDNAPVGIAAAKDRGELLDLLHRVFTRGNPAHPRLEKMYPDLFVQDDEAIGRHAIARDGGRIVACVGAYPCAMRTAGLVLRAAAIGQVGTDAGHEGRGHMGRLMRFQLRRLKDEGVVVAWLGGRHDRYAHFGFETAGLSFDYSLDERSLRDVRATRRVARFADKPGEAVTDGMFGLFMETSPACAIEPARRFRARLARAGCELWTATPAGATEPDAWAVVSREWGKIDVCCGATDGLLEIAAGACKAMGRGLYVEVPAACRGLGDAFRAHCHHVSAAMTEMLVLDPGALVKAFRDQGWNGPDPAGREFAPGEAERFFFGPEPVPGGGAPLPLSIPSIYHA